MKCEYINFPGFTQLFSAHNFLFYFHFTSIQLMLFSLGMGWSWEHTHTHNRMKVRTGAREHEFNKSFRSLIQPRQAALAYWILSFLYEFFFRFQLIRNFSVMVGRVWEEQDDCECAEAEFHRFSAFRWKFFSRAPTSCERARPLISTNNFFARLTCTGGWQQSEMWGKSRSNKKMWIFLGCSRIVRNTHTTWNYIFYMPCHQAAGCDFFVSRGPVAAFELFSFPHSLRLTFWDALWLKRTICRAVEMFT